MNTSSDSLFLSEAKNRQGKPLTSGGIYYICKTWFGVFPHALRHTLCSHLISQGMDSMLAMQITGHKSTSSFKRYSDRALKDKAKEAFLRLGDR